MVDSTKNKTWVIIHYYDIFVLLHQSPAPPQQKNLGVFTEGGNNEGFGWRFLNIQVPDCLGMRLDESLARGSTASPISMSKVRSASAASSTPTSSRVRLVGVHGGFPKLGRVHLAQAFVARSG